MAQETANKSNTESAILGIEMQLNAYEEDLIALSHDIDYLTTYLGELNKAYIFLKKPEVIVSLAEYKKVVIETAHVVGKIQTLRNTRLMVERKIEAKEKALEYYNIMFQNEFEANLTKVLEFVRKDK